MPRDFLRRTSASEVHFYFKYAPHTVILNKKLFLTWRRNDVSIESCLLSVSLSFCSAGVVWGHYLSKVRGSERCRVTFWFYFHFFGWASQLVVTFCHLTPSSLFLARAHGSGILVPQPGVEPWALRSESLNPDPPEVTRLGVMELAEGPRSMWIRKPMLQIMTDVSWVLNIGEPCLGEYCNS